MYIIPLFIGITRKKWQSKLDYFLLKNHILCGSFFCNLNNFYHSLSWKLIISINLPSDYYNMSIKMYIVVSSRTHSQICPNETYLVSRSRKCLAYAHSWHYNKNLMVWMCAFEHFLFADLVSQLGLEFLEINNALH